MDDARPAAEVRDDTISCHGPVGSATPRKLWHDPGSIAGAMCVLVVVTAIASRVAQLPIFAVVNIGMAVAAAVVCIASVVAGQSSTGSARLRRACRALRGVAAALLLGAAGLATRYLDPELGSPFRVVAVEAVAATAVIVSIVIGSLIPPNDRIGDVPSPMGG